MNGVNNVKSVRHTIIAAVDNKPGVVSRISGLFTRRGYNIESFVTCTTRDPAVYNLIFSVIGTRGEVELLTQQLGRVMEVIAIWSADDVDCVVRGLMFIKLRCPADRRAELIGLVDNIKRSGAAEVIVAGVGEKSIIIQASGEEVALDALPRIFSNYEIIDVIRSGAVAVTIE